DAPELLSNDLPGRRLVHAARRGRRCRAPPRADPSPPRARRPGDHPALRAAALARGEGRNRRVAGARERSPVGWRDASGLGAVPLRSFTSAPDGPPPPRPGPTPPPPPIPRTPPPPPPL